MNTFRREECPDHRGCFHKLVRFDAVGGIYFIPCPGCVSGSPTNAEVDRHNRVLSRIVATLDHQREAMDLAEQAVLSTAVVKPEGGEPL